MDNKKMTFGSYGGNPIEWRVIQEDDLNIWLVADKAIESLPFEEEYCEVDWEHCSLRKWLNNEFLQTAFTDDERECIDEGLYINSGNAKYGIGRLNDTIDRVTIPSIEDVKKFFKNNDARKCEATTTAVEHGVFIWKKTNCCNWWLRNPGNALDKVAFISTSGYIKEDSAPPDLKYFGVRPMIALYK